MLARRPSADPQALTRAYATLVAGCAFVTLRAEEQSRGGPGLAVLSHTRMVGNQLRELDRFLSNLLDETARWLGAPAGEIRLLAGLRNTARKLHLLRTMTKLRGQDEARLRAIGRIGACLHHCAGQVHARASLRRDVRLAHGEILDGSTCPADFTDQLRLAPGTLVSICEFYGAIGHHLQALPRGRAPIADRPAGPAEARGGSFVPNRMTPPAARKSRLVPKRGAVAPPRPDRKPRSAFPSPT